MPQGLVIYWNSIKTECQSEKTTFIYSEETTIEEHLDQIAESLILLITYYLDSSVCSNESAWLDS